MARRNIYVILKSDLEYFMVSWKYQLGESASLLSSVKIILIDRNLLEYLATNKICEGTVKYLEIVLIYNVSRTYENNVWSNIY